MESRQREADAFTNRLHTIESEELRLVQRRRGRA